MRKAFTDPQSAASINVSKVKGQSHTALVSPPCLLRSFFTMLRITTKNIFLNNVFIGSVSNPSGRPCAVSVHSGQHSDR